MAHEIGSMLAKVARPIHNAALFQFCSIGRFMKKANNVIVFMFCLLAFVSLPANGHEISKQMTEAANLFLRSLDSSQTRQISFSFDDKLRQDWQFIPMERKGLGLKQMKPNQRMLALTLVQTALSHRGFSTTMKIMALEQVLHEMENQSPKRDPEKYHLFFFGTPSNDATWAWRIEGHHLSISFTIVDGKTVVTTPAFFGANPGEVRQGNLKGLRVLAKEEDLGRSLVKSLSVDQKKIAVLDSKPPSDIINGPGRKAVPLEPAGIASREMTDAQRQTLKDLISSYVNKFRTELANEDLAKIENAGFDQIHFAWSGKFAKGEPHYYRVQGPTFIMEYDNTQNNANHVHVVWRDFNNDFGADLLQKHYQEVPHK